MSESLVFRFQDFVAPTAFSFHKLVKPEAARDVTPVGLDIGYSATKVFSSNGRHVFPSYLRKDSRSQPIELNSKNDMKYEDEDGEVWLVGDIAYRQDQAKLYRESILMERERVSSQEYRILGRIGLALALLNNHGEVSDLPLKVYTGLPAAYLRVDSARVTQQFVGEHKFKLYLNRLKRWIPFHFRIEEDDIDVIAQPTGTLFSLVANTMGNYVNLPMLLQKTLVVDGGFHTVDMHYSINGTPGNPETAEDLAMHEVFTRTKATIMNAIGDDREIQVSDLVKYMIDPVRPGVIEYGKDHRTYNFADEFKKNFDAVGRELVRTLATRYHNFNEVDQLVLTGGTGLAFLPFFEAEHAAKIRLAANPDALPPLNFTPTFANVVGFYNVLMMNLCKTTAAAEVAATAEPPAPPRTPRAAAKSSGAKTTRSTKVVPPPQEDEDDEVGEEVNEEFGDFEEVAG